MFEGFEIIRHEKGGDEVCDTTYTVWKHKKFFDENAVKKRGVALISSTSLVCDSMTPAEREDDEMAAKYFENKFDIIRKAGFEIMALYRNITKFKNGIDKKGNKKDDVYTWRIEVWNAEHKNAVGNIPTTSKY